MLTVPRRISFVGKAEYMDSWKTKYLFPALGMIPIDRAGGDKRQAPSTRPRACCAGASCSASSPRAPAAATACSTRATPARPGWRCKVGCPIFPVGIIGTGEIQPPDAKVPKLRTARARSRIGRPDQRRALPRPRRRPPGPAPDHRRGDVRDPGADRPGLPRRVRRRRRPRASRPTRHASPHVDDSGGRAGEPAARLSAG